MNAFYKSTKSTDITCTFEVDACTRSISHNKNLFMPNYLFPLIVPMGYKIQ